LILSVKAGETGLNLNAAEHVFHFDRWWNPPSKSRQPTLEFGSELSLRHEALSE
jgi:hypothetical protein